MNLERQKDGFAHYVPYIKPNQRGYTFNFTAPFPAATLSRLAGSGVNPSGLIITTEKDSTIDVRARKFENIVGSSDYKFITLPGMTLSFDMGNIAPGVGFLDISCNLKAPSFLFRSTGRYSKAWTMIINPSRSMELVGEAIAKILVKDDASHSYAQFIAKQAVNIVANEVPEDISVSFVLEINPSTIDLTSKWDAYNFVAEVVVVLFSHTVTKLSLIHI